MNTLFSAFAAVLAAAWLPIIHKFYVSWRARKNPVSLAICWLILVVAYSHALYILTTSFEADVAWVVAISLTFSLVACVNFYVSFYWSSKKFKDQRRAATPPTPPLA